MRNLNVTGLRMTLEELSLVVVEPSPTQWRIIAGHLRQLGVTDPSWFQNGAKALEAMHEIKPDLVISAMYLPDMTGSELVSRIREDAGLHDILFMLVSSETSEHFLDPIRQSGVVAILSKPFEPKDLRRALNAAVDFITPDNSGEDEGAIEALRVLVVDDSLTSRHHIMRILNNIGIEHVIEACNGPEAIRAIEGNFFDLVVTDYNMPEMDGCQLVRYIREKSTQASVPILMVTSYADRQELSAVKQAGVTAVAGKPFEPSGLKTLIRRLLAEG